MSGPWEDFQDGPWSDFQRKKRGVVQDITGVMATINANIPGFDEVAAAGNTAVNAAKDGVRGIQGPGLVDRFKGELGRQRGFEADLAGARPKVAALARGTGMAGGALAPAGASFNALSKAPRIINAGRGALAAATTAGAYAAADRGTVSERGQAATKAALDPLTLMLGAAGGALAPATKAAPKASPQQVLKDAGVFLTPGQQVGGLAKNVEDLGLRAPILGPAIHGARERANTSLNRSIALSALEPIGKKLPKSVKPGWDTIRYVDDEIGKVYDEAADLVPFVTEDAELAQDLAQIAKRKVDLPESFAGTFDNIIEDRLARLRNGVTGRGLKDIHEELGILQRQYAGKGGEQGVLGGMIGDARRAIIGTLGRADPKAAELVDQADDAWAVYSLMNDAAANTKTGQFTPGQFMTQVRSAGKKYSRRGVGKGEALMQDIASAASDVMPDQFGNPGTANALGLGGGAVGLMTEPATTLAAGAGLTAAATPYFAMGRRIIESLPEKATAAQLGAAMDDLSLLASSDPAVEALRRQVAARLAAAGGVVGASASAQSGQ